MSLLGSETLYNMSLTIKQLSEKHQLNPKNNGVNAIDQLIFYDDTLDKLCIGDMLHVMPLGMVDTYNITIEDVGTFPIAATTCVLLPNGQYGCINDGKIQAGQNVTVITNGHKTTKSVISYELCQLMYNYYRIRSARTNMVTAEGLVVKSD